jgi:hypothetical protein
MPLTQVPPALLTATTGTGTTVVLGTSPTITTPTISGYLNLPTWTTGTRPSSPLTGQTGWNSTLSSMEVYNGAVWQSITTTGKSIAMSIVFGGN